MDRPPRLGHARRMNTAPLGPAVDPAPRPLPARIAIRGQYAVLEPLHPRHVPDLWRAAQGADASWDYMSYGPFPTQQALAAQVAGMASTHDPMVWAVRLVANGTVCGWLALMNIEPRNAAIEIGGIWFAPAMQRTRAGTEAIYLLLRLAADELGYRRLVWKCNALNTASGRAALRLGFTYEGRHRAHMVVKGRSRDTDWYSILDAEWPAVRAGLQAWLDPANFDPDGTARHGLAELRARG